MTTLPLKDSGKREQFQTGAMRDAADDKPRPGLLSPFAAERKARIMALGAKKYAARNWEKGMPFSRVLDSLERHLTAWKQGQMDEDHLAQLAWNADALLHFEEGIKRGFLPAELDDMPRYVQQIPCHGATEPYPDPQTAKDAVDSTVAPEPKEKHGTERRAHPLPPSIGGPYTDRVPHTSGDTNCQRHHVSYRCHG